MKVIIIIKKNGGKKGNFLALIIPRWVGSSSWWVTGSSDNLFCGVQISLP